jgi:hypothetical protein
VYEHEDDVVVDDDDDVDERSSSRMFNEHKFARRKMPHFGAQVRQTAGCFSIAFVGSIPFDVQFLFVFLRVRKHAHA